jgi:23S rRNA pseudouridine1911/1915/1917 synthase
MTKEFEHYKFVADPGQTQVRVDVFLTNKIEGISRSRIQAAVKENCIKVNGKVVKANYKVKGGDEVAVVFDYERRELKIIAEDIPLDVVYEDEDLIVINKPAGMVVHPGCGNYTGTLVNALANHVTDSPLFQNNEGDVRPGLVHRIDKNTTGLLVIAKNEDAKTHLAGQFFDRTVNRRYIAMVWGDIREEGRVETRLGRSLKNRQVMDNFELDSEYGKIAITNYKPIESFTYVSMIECKLETGRTHQIRAHMKHIKHPLFNDDTYGGDAILKGTTFTKYRQFVQNCFKELPRHALHAKTLEFTHPRTGELMSFNSELPEDMKNCIEKWRGYANHVIE